MSLPSNALDLFGTPAPRTPDNADPHTVALSVHPREVIDGAEYEADYEVAVTHPDTCSELVEDCPVADLIEIDGLGRDFYVGFPEPDHLSDADLAVLDGTVRFLTVTRLARWYSNPGEGGGCDVEYDFTWSD